MSDSQYYTVETAAQRLGLSRQRIRQLVAAGELEVRVEGGRRAIDLAAIERLEARRREPSLRRGRRPEGTSHATAEAVYRYIIRYKRMHAGESPTRREIAAAVGLSSPSTVNSHLAALEREGRIRLAQPAGKARMIAIPGASWEFDEIGAAEIRANKCAEGGVHEMADVS